MDGSEQATLAALTGAVVMLVNKLSAYLDKMASKHRGDSIDDKIARLQNMADEADKRLALLEARVEAVFGTVALMSDKVDKFHKGLLEFREEARVNAAATRAYIRGKKEGQTNA